MNPIPALREVDIFPVEHEGTHYFCLSDPTGIVETPILLSPPAALIATQMDGTAGIDAVCAKVATELGQRAISHDDIAQLIAQLDATGYLYSETFERMRENVAQAFAANPIRPPYFAGKSYPDDPDALRALIDSFYTGPAGPGVIPVPAGAETPPIPGIVSPHIDFGRGGPCYAHAYAAMARHGTPATVIIFGVAHAAEPVPFILTRKAFDTPLGTLDVDHDALDAIEAACDFDPYTYELTHRTEHSIEFQAVMLAHVYGPGIKIVPILTSHFAEVPGEDFEADPVVNRFLEACAEVAADPARRISVVAGADLAHAGRRFGDDFDVGPERLDAIMRRDQHAFAAIANASPEAFYTSISRDGNSHNVCGHRAIYSTLRTLDRQNITMDLLDHSSAEDPAGGVVTFAAMSASPATP